jgi:hypothetical protein
LAELSKKSLAQRFQVVHGAEGEIIRYGRRGSVSAESLPVTDEDDEPAIVIPKSDEAKMRITTAIASNLLFRHLDDEQRRPVASEQLGQEFV